MLRGVLIGLLSYGDKYPDMRIDFMQTPQRQPRSNLARMPNSNKSFMDVISPQIRKIDIVDQIFIDVVDEYSSLVMDCRKD